MFVWPVSVAPLASSASTAAALYGGRQSPSTFDAAVVASPATQKLALI
jgi:hypothetical protein